MFQEMQVGTGGVPFPSSDNIKYAFEGTSLMHRNTTEPVANAPTIPSQNLGDKMLLCLKANTAFMVIPVSQGEHDVELVYFTPYLKQGLLCSLVSLIGLGIYSFFTGKKKEV